MKIIIFNCGSSSIKYKLFKMPESYVIASGIVERIGSESSSASQQANDKNIKIEEHVDNHEQGISVIKKMLIDPQNGAIQSLSEIKACGHRVVHGGEAFTNSVLITEDLEKVIEEFADLAPLHNPPNLLGIRAVKKMLGNIPQVACFDTAFHQTLPEVAYLYALPYEFYEKYKIRKYGFHGTSHRFIARRAAELMKRGKYDVDLITCHLGNGSSIAAVKNGKSIDTSMGLTPLEGLVMGTRAGDLDAAIVFHLVRKGYSIEQLDAILNKKSGLLGISGVSNDVRDLEQHAKNGHKKAQLALDIFTYKIKKYIGLYFAVMNGCNGIVFTGGIGENAVQIRESILTGLDSLGIILDPDKNKKFVNGKEGEIQKMDSRVKIFVIPTDEEQAIAKDTFAIVTEITQ